MNLLKQYREKQKMTQEELAEKSGISRVTISGIENGNLETVKTGTLVKIADALNEPVSAVFFANDV